MRTRPIFQKYQKKIYFLLVFGIMNLYVKHILILNENIVFLFLY
jgi:hypothetical protein